MTTSKRYCVRVALISDTHGVLDERIAKLICTCDAVVHAGDIGGSKVRQALKPRLGIILAIKGNNDVASKWPRDETRFLSRLDDHAYLDLPGGRLAVVHGDQFNPVRRRHDKLRQAFNDARAIVYGHSHRVTIDDTQIPWVLNTPAPQAGHEPTAALHAWCLRQPGVAGSWKPNASKRRWYSTDSRACPRQSYGTQRFTAQHNPEQLLDPHSVYMPPRTTSPVFEIAPSDNYR